MLKCPFSPHAIGKENVGVFRSILPMLADLVEDQRFAKLKELCICPPDTAPGTKDTMGSIWKHEAVVRIEARGVDLHRYGKDGEKLTVEEHRDFHPESNTGLGEVETAPEIEV